LAALPGVDNWAAGDGKVWQGIIENAPPTSSPTASVLDGFPNMQVLDPLRIGQNVKEIIECDLARDRRAHLYRKPPPYSRRQDYVSRDLFEA